jgi:hypothetical protein
MSITIHHFKVFICLHLASLSLSVQLFFNFFSRKKYSLLITFTVESLSLVKVISSFLSICCIPVSSDRSKNFLKSFLFLYVLLLLFYSSPVCLKPHVCAKVIWSNDSRINLSMNHRGGGTGAKSDDSIENAGLLILFRSELRTLE